MIKTLSDISLKNVYTAYKVSDAGKMEVLGTEMKKNKG